MAKIRVYELAKSLNKDSKEIIEILKKNGVEIKNHMSSVSDEEAEKVRARFAGSKPDKAEKPVKAAPSSEERKPHSEENSNTGKPQGERRPDSRGAGERRPDGSRPQGDRRDGRMGERRPDGRPPRGDRGDIREPQSRT